MLPRSHSSPLLVFDLDGTLADTAGDLIATLNIILDREGVAPVPLEIARPMLGAGSRALIQRGFDAAGLTVTSERLEVMFLDFLEYYEAHICDRSILFPGVEDALDRFSEIGWNFAVCTNKIEHPSIALLTALGVAHRFQAICGKNSFPVCKPDPRALLMTIDRAGGDPRKSIMVGDSRTDIETARGAGIPIIAVDFGYTDTPVSELGPDRIISHFDALWDSVTDLNREPARMLDWL